MGNAAAVGALVGLVIVVIATVAHVWRWSGPIKARNSQGIPKANLVPMRTRPGQTISDPIAGLSYDERDALIARFTDDSRDPCWNTHNAKEAAWTVHWWMIENGYRLRQVYGQKVVT